MNRTLLTMILALAIASHATLAKADPPSAKREVPDFGGPPPERTTPGNVALWVPRIVLSPLYFTSEYLIRRPLAAAIPAAERADLPNKIYDFFTFGPEHKAGFAPVGFVEFGFNPSVGVYAFWDDAFFRGNALRLHAEAWPDDWLAGSLTERVQIDEERTLTLRVSGVRRPDNVFYGLGPSTVQSSQSRYTEDRVDAGASFEWRPWRASRLQTGAGFRAVSLYHGHFGGDPSLEQEAATGAFPLPYGFERGYSEEYSRLLFAVDTRGSTREPTSGVRIELQGEQGNDFRRSPGSGWIRYGASAGGFLDLNQHGRVVSLSVLTSFADPFGSAPIPFTELVLLGGNGPMRGFYTGRLIDRSAAVATLSYQWPIGPWFDGDIQVAMGNVFGEHLDDFAPRLLRLSGALGLSTVGLQDAPLELLVGAGTETFAHGAQLDVVRVSLGVPRSF
jgi:hypothetical protein